MAGCGGAFTQPEGKKSNRNSRHRGREGVRKADSWIKLPFNPWSHPQSKEEKKSEGEFVGHSNLEERGAQLG